MNDQHLGRIEEKDSIDIETERTEVHRILKIVLLRKWIGKKRRERPQCGCFGIEEDLKVMEYKGWTMTNAITSV